MVVVGIQEECVRSVAQSDVAAAVHWQVNDDLRVTGKSECGIKFRKSLADKLFESVSKILIA